MWDAIINCLQNHERIIISSHQNPDCDALGSELALAYHLRYLGKQVTILNSDPTPENYTFLDPDGLIQIYSEKKHGRTLQKADLVIVLDASSGWSRLGRVGNELGQLQTSSICIDHHLDPEPFADFMLVDAKVIATGELIFDLITTMQGHISPIMAQALYAALITDSGNFRFEKTSPRTHLIAAQLLETGIDQSDIYRRIYEQNSLNKVHIKGYVLQNLQLAYEGRVAYVSLDEATLKHFQISPFNVDGFSGVGLDIQGVVMSIFAIALPRGRVKLSLRSDGSIGVNQLAAHFGGGGHAPAAGATIKGDVNEIMAELLEKTGEFF